MKETRKIIFFYILAGLFVTHGSFAACELPVPDSGGGSDPAVAGVITKIRSPLVSIRDEKTSISYAFLVSPKTSVFTAFGGDGKPSDLKVGLAARVWIPNCKAADSLKNNSIAYFEVFSFTLDDPSPKSYLRP